MTRMPRLRAQNPNCGACGRETRYQSEQYICEECLLGYGDGEDETPAEFLVEESAGCNKPCDNFWHGNLGIIKHVNQKDPHGIGKFVCHPCRLPEGHTSMCWTNCEPINLKEGS